MEEKNFRVMSYCNPGTVKETHCDPILWSLVAPHEARAYKNHYQSLERLNARGGLSPRELYCVLNDVGFWDQNSY